MGSVKSFRMNIWIAMVIVVILVSACSEMDQFTPTPGRQTYPVDVVLKEFYQALGGQQVLGPAIRPLEIRESLQCQFTERALLCFNPAVTDATRFSLYPLGKELKVQEDSTLVASVAQDRAPGGRIVEGFTIYERFLPLYDQLYGARYVGRPLTELRINQDLQRVEQFFENVGFYQDLKDPNGPVYLIPYGAYLCGGDCSYRLNEYWSVVKSNMTEQPYAESIARLGGPAVFGSLLLKPQIADDGALQQVYANAIFYAPVDDPSQVRLRPLPLMLGYQQQPLMEKKSHDQLVFYEVENGLGHNVPRPFDEFIAMHGGRDLSGSPLSEVQMVSGQNLYQQCFENYCLIFDPAAAETMKVRLAPLGQEYVDRNPPPEDVRITNLFSPERIRLTISVDKPNMNGNEEQTVRVSVWARETEQPLERVEGTLVLNIPNRTPIRFALPPTDGNGMSVVVIPPQPDLPNGVRLSYEVCLNLPSELPICAVDSYLIWNIQ